jgi:hypothetical protein
LWDDKKVAIGPFVRPPKAAPGALSIKRSTAIFYRTEAANEPVRDWLKEMDRQSRRRIGEDIKLVEYGLPIGMPVCRPLGEGLHEVRRT